MQSHGFGFYGRRAQCHCRSLPQSCFHLASLTSGAFSSPGGDASLAEFTRWRDESKPLFVHFDLSVFRSPLSALCDHPRLGGCDLETVSRWLGTLGRHWVSAIMLTGLNPSRPGMGVVKVGQRLMVTALLTFIYAQLGFYIANAEQVTAKENELT